MHNPSMIRSRLNRGAGLSAGLAMALLMATSPAAAQPEAPQLDSPPPMVDTDRPPSGEAYHVEGFAGLWAPSAQMSISSEGGGALRGIIGSTIDFKQDLGLSDGRFRELRLVLRPARKHKFRFLSIPVRYVEGPVTVARDLIFNGQAFRAGLPVNWQVDWTAYHIGYEYDVVVWNSGFAGFILEAKYTDVRAELTSPATPDEFVQQQAPIPAFGGVLRVYVVPDISITAEVTGMKVPDRISEDFKAHYADVDIYGTVNFSPNFGAQIDYRSLDLGYLIDADTGAFVLKGVYFGVVGRF